MADDCPNFKGKRRSKNDKKREYVFASEKKKHKCLNLTPKIKRCSMLCVTLLSFCAMLFAIAISTLLKYHKVTLSNEVAPVDIYSVVFDAGSTGSRLFVFHFHYNEKEDISGPNLTLAEEYFQSIEPGVSSYVRNPQMATTGLEPMLLNAIETVPEHHQPDTLITVKATAGLRLLPREQGDKIIKELRYFFLQKSPFYLPDDDKIEIVSSEEEGLYGWMSVNFLLDVLWDDNLDNTVSALDLGGGSLQTTYEFPSEVDVSKNEVMNNMFKVVLNQAQFMVFTHSFLGYGLKSARLAVMQWETQSVAKLHKQEPVPEDEFVLYSPCHLYGTNLTWEHQSTTYEVRGTVNSLTNLPSCYDKVLQFVTSRPMVSSEFLWQREMHLFSYFFDVAVWAGLIRPTDSHNMLAPRDYLDAAVFYCDHENNSQDYPFLCMDLVYIYHLLVKGLDIPQNTQMHVEKKLVGREVNWSLGAALASLIEDFSYTSLRLN